MPESAAERAAREAAEAEQAAAAAAAEVDFEDENGRDGDKAIEYTRTLKLEFATDDVEFWFTQIETEMYTCGVKSQWLKRCVLVKNLPPKVQSDVKGLLTLKQSAAPADIYKRIKNELLRIHAPKEEETFKKALGRVLVGLPSQLGEQLVNDICGKPTKLSCGCCHKAVKTLWAMQLPAAVRGQIANMPFNETTYHDVFQAADNVYLSTKSTDMSPSVAAVVNVDRTESGAEVAAVGGARPPKKNNNNKNQGGGNKPNNGGGKPQRRGPRHSSNPPSTCCDNHYRWGSASWFCLAPLSCPWKDKCSSRPEKKNEKKD